MVTKADNTEKTEQNIVNKSYDVDFDVLAFEMLGYDSDAGVLRRIKVNASGEIMGAV